MESKGQTQTFSLRHKMGIKLWKWEWLMWGAPGHFGNISWFCDCDTNVMDSAHHPSRGSISLPQRLLSDACLHPPGCQVHSSPSPSSAGQAWLCWAWGQGRGQKGRANSSPPAWVQTEMTKMSANQGQRFKSRQRGTGRGGVWTADRGGTSQVCKRLPPPSNF